MPHQVTQAYSTSQSGAISPNSVSVLDSLNRLYKLHIPFRAGVYGGLLPVLWKHLPDNNGGKACFHTRIHKTRSMNGHDIFDVLTHKCIYIDIHYFVLFTFTKMHMSTFFTLNLSQLFWSPQSWFG